MASLNSDVTYACLHTTIFVPGLGQFGPTLVLGSSGTISKVTKMTLSDNVLQVDVAGASLAIPLGNITHMKLAPVK